MAARRKREPDPPDVLSALEAGLAGKGLARGYVLRGEERYFRERAIDCLKKKGSEEGYELCLHDADRANPDFRLSGLTDDLAGGGLFAAKRLVVVRNPERLLAKEGTKDSALTRSIRSFLGASEDAGAVVLSAASLRADHAVSKAVRAAGGELASFRKLWEGPPPWDPDPRKAELTRWVLRRAKELGVRLSPDRAVYVCAATGNDLDALDAVLVRIQRSPGGAFEETVGWSAQAAPWTVADELLEGRMPRALSLVETLFRGGFKEKSGRRQVDVTTLSTVLLASLSRGLRQSLFLASELERGGGEARALAASGLPPRTGATALARARAAPARVWRARLEDVADLERRAKSSAGVDANDFAALALRWRR